MTALIVVALTAFAMFTSMDFVILGPVLIIILSMAVMMSMIFMFVFFFNDKLRVVYCTIGVIIFSIYLVMDTQLIMGGKRYEIEVDDYILGAIILYTDIVMIFLYLLRILSKR